MNLKHFTRSLDVQVLLPPPGISESLLAGANVGPPHLHSTVLRRQIARSGQNWQAINELAPVGMTPTWCYRTEIAAEIEEVVCGNGIACGN